VRFLAAVLACVALGAQALEIERLRLPGEAGHQVYNLQEQGPWRVWARSAAGFKGSEIWLQRRGDDGRWGEAAPWPRHEAAWRDSDPFLSADGRRLLFVSDRGGNGQLDLYESRWDGQAWSAPQRLPEALQSRQYELGIEQHGARLWFGSARSGKLAIYAASTAEGDAPPQALPAPVNEGAANSDPTLTPDGRYLLWWSQRSGNGDLYLAERLADGRYGPALRLPEPINHAQGFEFTPWVSADGEWLFFASTRPNDDKNEPVGLSKLYRVRWPALLRALPQAQAASQAELDAAVSRLWRAIGHGANEASDTATLRALLHPQARIWGSGVRERERRLDAMTAEDFLAALAKPSPKALQECELQREQRRHGSFAEVHSRVRSDVPGAPSYSGVNSQQWHWDAARGWQLLSLHYALDLPGEPLDATGRCRG
jgi:hypothetical protein